MNQLPKKITGEPPKKMPHPLDGRKDLSLVERVQVAVTKALNPEQGAKLEKATGMTNDVKKLADDGMERSLLNTDKPPTGSDGSDQLNKPKKKKIPNPDEIAVGYKAYSKNYLRRQLGLLPPQRAAETEADEESRIATLPKETPSHKDPLTREKKAILMMKQAMAVSDSLEFDLPAMAPTVKLAAFLTGMAETAGSAMPDFESKPHLLPAFLAGLQQEGVFKQAGMEDLDAFASKLAGLLDGFRGWLAGVQSTPPMQRLVFENKAKPSLARMLQPQAPRSKPGLTPVAPELTTPVGLSSTVT